MTQETILITGGCRSGKSRQALTLARDFPGRKLYLATAEPLDEEMKERIRRHQSERDDEWTTVEEPVRVAEVLQREGRSEGVIVVDCLTLWISNLLRNDLAPEAVLERVRTLAAAGRTASALIVITNEVGAGIVPENELARKFRDLAGEANQILASRFDRVVHMVSGIPVFLKGGGEPAGPSPQETPRPHEFPPAHKQGVYEAIYRRRDMRHFTRTPIDPEVLGRILDAAHHAGSVGFMQPWNFLVIDDAEIKRKVARNFKKANETAARKFRGDRQELYRSLKLEGIEQSPINLCVTCDRSRAGPHVLGRDTVPETDLFSTCCAVQNLWLAARAEGLAVGWVSILSPEQLKKDLGVPEHVEPVAYLCLGHTESFDPKPLLESRGWAARLPLDRLIFYNRWNGEAENFTVQLPRAKPES